MLDGPLETPGEREIEAIDGELEPSLEPGVEDDQAGNDNAGSGGAIRSAFRRAGLIR